ncbi:putative DNA modification/repair radical SAM protein [uncultured Clostridium sp.]|uniref:putative DNA modification/repair radical SAM protein n=1 Tax=uncultured Clostridium sp. TaxID=59620 RepID=UPI00258F9D93|nr:putative DNA modification/repair radical SAM protein [uncultured Clostridium sp.]
MLIQENLSIEEKLRILSDAAKYDAACTSSGVGRKGKEGFLGNSRVDGICHSFASDGRCISLLKILFTNQCIYDCHYCANRRSNDTVRTSFTPEEVCRLTMEFYRRNYIEGLFLSSGVLDTPDYTMELLYQTLYRLRRVHRFNGYIHVKAIPGADPELIERVGFLADRMSVNLELPTADGLARLAPGKTRDKILRPMRQIQTGIARQLEQEGRLESRGAWLPQKERGEIQIPGDGRHGIGGKAIGKGEKECLQAVIPGRSIYGSFGLGNISNRKNYFVPGGQSTQLIVGATPESDYQMVAVAEALYRNFGLKRVFYSAFIKVNEDSLLPDLPDGPPLLREHRLYQADWLMRYYGFRASELLSEKHPNFNVFLDPKCDWALQNLGEFPVEINRAPYETLLRVPGIGVKSAMRIVAARKQVALRFEDLKKMGVVLKRAVYFITCSGRMMYPVQIHEDAIAAQLISEEKRKQWQLSQSGLYRQMSLFDDFHMAQA